MEVKGRTVAVVGFGLTGRAVVEFLLRKGARVLVSEKDKGKEDQLRQLAEKGVEVELGQHSAEFLSKADLVVVSPGVDWNAPFLEELRRRGKEVIPEIDLAYPFIKGRIIGITGSNGKSTTTSLVHHILKEAGVKSVLAGNIGRALIDAVEEEGEYFVVELSSFQLEGSRIFSPYISVMLNCTPDHLDRHRTMESYCGAKERLFENQRDGFAIMNYDDPRRTIWERKVRVPAYFFSRKKRVKGLFLSGDRAFWEDGREAFRVEKLRIKGVHNAENAMAAFLACHLCGLDDEDIRKGLYSFSPLPHRMEIFAVWKGITFVNDSKATNIDSVRRALEGMKNPVILIMGGKDKGTSFSPLSEIVKEKVKLLITIGQAAERIEKELEGAAPMARAEDMDDAVKIALEAAERGDWVMLSPGCASFDMFRNFEERGEVFKEAVRRRTGA